MNNQEASGHGPCGSLYVISAPSGAGKTSLVRALEREAENLVVSVSHTTRAPRAGEREGADYHFISEPDFQAMLDGGAFLEHAEVFDHHYGTSRQWVLDRLNEALDVILEIDWQGARQIHAQLPESVGIMVLPPSQMVLETRLRTRGQDSEQVVARRMAGAVAEMSHFRDFDYLVINDDFECALKDLLAIIRARRARREFQLPARADLLKGLLETG